MSQTPENINKQRIAKNTLILYVRMLFLMLAGFYTIRLLLAALGVEDYGLYNVLFGLVTSFSFFSGAMHSTVQRFLCHEMGEGKTDGAKQVFGVSVFLFLTVALLVIIFAETAGLWFVRNKMTIPAGKMGTALTVYHISIFMVVFKLLQIPYTSTVTSHENMSIYSWFCIADSMLHLVSVLALKYIVSERLVWFVSLYTVSNLLILLFYILYCRRKYEICQTGLKLNRSYLKSMTSFFSWSLFGAIANILKQQGLNLLLNIFYGVVLNATWGIASQVGNAVSQLVASFQQAFNPQILKSYNTAEKKVFYELLQNCSKYSFILIWLIALPILLKTEFFLKLWLGETLSEGAVFFTQMMIIYMLFEALSCPMWIAIQATGNIKLYQISISCISGSIFVFSLIALKLGASGNSVALINAAVNMVAFVYRLFYLYVEIQFPILYYCQKTLLPITAAILTSGLCGILICSFSADTWYQTIVCLILITIANLIILLFIILSRPEREYLTHYFSHKFSFAQGA